MFTCIIMRKECIQIYLASNLLHGGLDKWKISSWKCVKCQVDTFVFPQFYLDFLIPLLDSFLTIFRSKQNVKLTTFHLIANKAQSSQNPKTMHLKGFSIMFSTSWNIKKTLLIWSLSKSFIQTHKCSLFILCIFICLISFYQVGF